MPEAALYTISLDGMAIFTARATYALAGLHIAGAPHREHRHSFEPDIGGFSIDGFAGTHWLIERQQRHRCSTC